MAVPLTLTPNNYSGQLYYSGPLSLRDVSTNRAERVHTELYEAAIDDLMRDLGNYSYEKDDEKYRKAPYHFIGEDLYIFDDDEFDYDDIENPDNPRLYISNYFIEDNIYSIIEMNGNEYWEPSSVYIVFRIFNTYNNKNIFVKKLYDLSAYWTPYLTKYEKNSTKVKVSKENMGDARIVHYDYINGKARMQSKLHEIEYDVDFDLLSPNDFIDNEILLPKELFAQIISTK